MSSISNVCVLMCLSPEATVVYVCAAAVCVQVKWLPKGLCALWSFMSGTFVIPIQRHKPFSPSLSVPRSLTRAHTHKHPILYISRLKLVIPPLPYSQYDTAATSPP